MQADSQKEDEEEKLDDDCTNGLNNYLKFLLWKIFIFLLISDFFSILFLSSFSIIFL